MLPELLKGISVMDSKQFLNDSFIKTTIGYLLPKWTEVNSQDIFVINYTSFMGKRYCDLIFKYKDSYIPITLNFTAEQSTTKPVYTDVILRYKLNFSMKNNALSSFLFDDNKQYNFNIDDFNDFFENDLLSFKKISAKFYNAKNQSINYKHETFLEYRLSADLVESRVPKKRSINFDYKSYYMDEQNGYFFTFYNDPITANEKFRLNQKMYFVVDTMKGRLSKEFNSDDIEIFLSHCYFDFNSFFRKAILHTHHLPDDILPHFDHYNDLLKYYDDNFDEIKALGNMIKI